MSITRKELDGLLAGFARGLKPTITDLQRRADAAERELKSMRRTLDTMKPATRYRGTWTEITDFATGDVCIFAGKAWMALAPSINRIPTEGGDAWHFISQL